MAGERYMDITVGGIAVKGLWAAHLSSVSVKDALDALDSATVVFDLPEGSGATLVPELDIYGKAWCVKLMEGSKTVKEYSGDVIAVSWTRSGGAPRQVSITCIDVLHRLKRGRANVKKYDRRWRDVPISDIVTAVAKDWKIGVSGIDSTKGTISDLEWKSDDSALLQHLAKECGCVVRCDFENGKPGLVFATAESYSNETVTLEFGVDILDISANHNIDKCVTEVTYTVNDPQKPAAPIKVTVTPSAAIKKQNKGKSGPEYLSDIGQFPVAFERKEGETAQQSSTEEAAKGKMIEASAGFVEGSLTCRFDPNLTSGKAVTVKGAGWPFDGTFVVKEVTHTFDASGYRSQVTFSSNSINAPS
jgi:hypothetical protein